jgi:hypothetical protein
MKKIFLTAIFICLFIHLYSQSRIDGVWKSNSGNLFQIEANNSGFYYKNLSTGMVLSTVYIGYNFGVPTYRANFNDGSFQLFMIKSDNMLTTSLSYAPNTIYIWKKQNSSNTYQQTGGNDNYNKSNNNSYNNQYKKDQQNTINFVPGASYITKKRYLDSQKELAKSRLKTAEKNYKNADPTGQTSYQFEIDRLNREINDIDLKLLDLEQMKLRGEIQ